MCDLQCDKHGEISKSHTLTKDEVEIMKFGVEFEVQNLCEDHYRDQFTFYQIRKSNNNCSDPCLRHSKVVKVNLSEVSLEFARKVKEFSEHRVIPGQKLCKHCISYLTELITSNKEMRCQDDEFADTQQLSGSEFDSLPFDSPM